MRRKHSLRVLIVDDDALLLDAVRCALEAHGCDVTTAGSIRSARQALRRAAVELVVCDWNLGHQTSEPLLRELTTERPGVPKILLTASQSPRCQDLVARGLVQARLDKPFDLGALWQVVKSVHAH